MRKSNFGFTLIELLIAILIFSIIVTVVYSTFSTGISVWKKIGAATQVSTNINSVLEDLARDLRGAINYRGLEFTGEKDKIYFCHLSDTILEDSQYREVYRTCYYTRSSSEEAGKFDLVKKEAPLLEGGFDIDGVPERKLISNLDEVKVEYAYKSSQEVIWKEAWKNPDDVPRGIRIKIFKDDIKLTKYVWVPTGNLVGLEAE